MEVNQISAEIILHDVLDIVLKYLEMDDLWNVLDVSKSWRCAALREQEKRLGIQLLRLPCKFVLHMCDVSLLICDSRFDSKAQLLENFKKYVPCKGIGIEVDEYLNTQDLEFQDAQDQRETKLTSKNDLLGIFFQRLQKQDCIRVAYSRSSSGNAIVKSEADRLVEELGLNDCQYYKSALLFFVQAYSMVSRCPYLAAELRSRIEAKNAEDTIWYARFKEMPKILNRPGNTQEEQQIVALRITGPSIRSWTIDVNLRLHRIKIETMLRRFKTKIMLKRHNIGLFYVPCKNLYDSSYELTSCMKRIFPEITFVGLFANLKNSIFSGFGYRNGKIVDFAAGAFIPDIYTREDKDSCMSVIVITCD